jgi:hypothetical protein
LVVFLHVTDVVSMVGVPSDVRYHGHKGILPIPVICVYMYIYIHSNNYDTKT